MNRIERRNIKRKEEAEIIKKNEEQHNRVFSKEASNPYSSFVNKKDFQDRYGNKYILNYENNDTFYELSGVNDGEKYNKRYEKDDEGYSIFYNRKNNENVKENKTKKKSSLFEKILKLPKGGKRRTKRRTKRTNKRKKTKTRMKRRKTSNRKTNKRRRKR